jgi:hypothetical protein
MRKLAGLVILGLMAIAPACGSNSSGGATGGSGGGGKTSGSGGTTSGSGGTISSSGGATSSSGGATSGSGGMTSGSGGATSGSGGTSGTSACVLPTCLKNLAGTCAEIGDCTTQTDFDTGSSNTCYANGIKEINVHDVLTDDRALTIKNGTSTCFTTAFNGNDVYTGFGSITVKDASGTTVASVRIDDTDSLYKVTCTGSQEVSLDKSCKSVWPVSGLMGTTCADGTCTP